MNKEDIVISRKAVHREHLILLCCFIVAYVVNIITILVYKRPASELYSTIGYVLAFTLLIYFALWIPRLLALLVRKLAGKK